MKKFRHKHLVALYAVCSKEEPILIVQEFMNNGALLEYLRIGAGANLMTNDLVYISAQVRKIIPNYEHPKESVICFYDCRLRADWNT